MITVYKMTSRRNTTYKATYWHPGHWKRTEPVDDPYLCSADVFHCYESIEQALLLYNTHVDYGDSGLKLWRAETDKIVANAFDKAGVFNLRLVEEAKYPEWATNIGTYKKVLISYIDYLYEIAKLNSLSSPSPGISLSYEIGRILSGAPRNIGQLQKCLYKVFKWVSGYIDIDFTKTAKMIIKGVMEQ